MSICVAIALAIPFQLLVFPTHARDVLRGSVADTLYRLSKVALDQVALSGRVLWSDDTTMVKADQARLAAELGSLERAVRDQDGLVAFAAAEYTSRERFDATRARAVVEALHRVLAPMADHVDLCAGAAVDPRVRSLLSRDGERVAATLAAHSSSVFWTLSASCASMLGLTELISQTRWPARRQEASRPSRRRRAQCWHRSSRRPRNRGSARASTRGPTCGAGGL